MGHLLIVLGGIFSFLDKAVVFIADHTWVLTVFFYRAHQGMVDAKKKCRYTVEKFFFITPRNHENNKFYALFKDSKCSQFIVSNLKCLGLIGPTTKSLCFSQKLYVTMTFAAISICK